MKIFAAIILTGFCFLFPQKVYSFLLCEDVELVLKTEISLECLRLKYNSMYYREHNTNIRVRFYESFIEDEYENIFDCLVHDDINMLQLYIDFVIAKDHSADESIAGVLGLLYLHRREDVLLLIEGYSSSQKKYLADKIEFGVRNYASHPRSIPFDMESIRQELSEIVNKKD